MDKPYHDVGKEFDDWFESRYEWGFGMKWLKPIAKRFAAAGWDAAKKEDLGQLLNTSTKIYLFGDYSTETYDPDGVFKRYHPNHIREKDGSI